MPLHEPIKTYRVLAEGVFARGSVRIDFSSDGLHFSKAERCFIDAEYLRARSETPTTFDGALAHVLAFRAFEGQIQLKCERTTYREYVGTNNTEFVARFGTAKIVNALSCGTVLITSDKRCIYGSRRRATSRSTYAIPAGFLSPDTDLRRNHLDPFLTIERELEEEAGIVREEIQEINCLGLLGNGGTYAAFVTQVAPSFDTIRRRSPREPEFEKFRSIEVASIERFLESDYDRMSPHSLGNMIFYHTYASSKSPKARIKKTSWSSVNSRRRLTKPQDS